MDFLFIINYKGEKTAAQIKMFMSSNVARRLSQTLDAAPFDLQIMILAQKIGERIYLNKATIERRQVSNSIA